VAELAGITRRLLSEWEAGRGNPGFQQLNRVLAVLGLQMSIGKRTPHESTTAEVLSDGKRVGLLVRRGNVYTFRYDDGYFHSTAPPISLSLPKTRQEYIANYLFPFFSGLLTEGTNKSLQTRQLHLDEEDEFSRLLLTPTSRTFRSTACPPASTGSRPPTTCSAPVCT
ncbi:MAG TPA: HipA N-terminal domain-containing protein, partial [Hymenobacter sp.]